MLFHYLYGHLESTLGELSDKDFAVVRLNAKDGIETATVERHLPIHNEQALEAAILLFDTVPVEYQASARARICKRLSDFNEIPPFATKFITKSKDSLGKMANILKSLNDAPQTAEQIQTRLAEIVNEISTVEEQLYPSEPENAAELRVQLDVLWAERVVLEEVLAEIIAAQITPAESVELKGDKTRIESAGEKPTGDKTKGESSGSDSDSDKKPEQVGITAEDTSKDVDDSKPKLSPELAESHKRLRREALRAERGY
jgi:hypothetical protein